MTSDRPSASPQVLTLDGRMGLTEAAPLRQHLLALDRTRDLRVCADAVSHLGALCLQVLVAAARDWQRAGRDFQLTPRSPAVAAALAQFALSPAPFGPEAAPWH
jgi:chemotaxis protein CheX